MLHEMDDGAEQARFSTLLHSLVYDKMEISEERLITPAKFPNPALGFAGLDGLNQPWRDMKVLKLMDAGVHTNLPLPPLLRPERQTDVIICLDQSSAPDIYSSVSIDIAAQFAQAEKMSFPDCTSFLAPDPVVAAAQAAAAEAVAAAAAAAAAAGAVAASASPAAASSSSAPKRQPKFSYAQGRLVTVVKGDVSKGIPTIIYLPLLRNDKFSKEFCPRANALAKGGFCSTFNFQYTSEQVMQLSGLTEQNMTDAAEEIKRALAEVTQEKIRWVQSGAAEQARLKRAQQFAAAKAHAERVAAELRAGASPSVAAAAGAAAAAAVSS
jgi:phospholipase A2